MTILAALSPISITSAVVGIAAVGALYALHYLRIQPQQRPMATLIFWRAAAGQLQSTALWSRRFHHPWTFVLLAAIAALLAASLSADRWKSTAHDADVTVIDCGSSMARPSLGDSIVLDDARLQVEQQLSTAAAPPTIIAAAEQPIIASTADQAAAIARRQMAFLRPSAAGSSSALSLQLAQSLLGNEAGSIDWYTDQSAVPVELPPRISSRVRLHQLHASDSASITSVVFEPAETDPYHGSLLVSVAANTKHPMDAALELDRPTRTTKPVTLTAGTTAVRFDGLVSDGSQIAIRLIGAPGSPLEQTVTFRLPHRVPLVFTCSGNVPRPLRDVLQTLGSIRPVGTTRAIAVFGADWPNAPAFCPIIRVIADAPLAASGEIVASDPLLRDMELEHVTCLAASSMPADFAPLLRAGDATVLGLDGSSRTLLVSNSLVSATADLPKRAAFPVLMQRVSGRLAGWTDGSQVVDSSRAINDPLWPSASTELTYSPPMLNDKPDAPLQLAGSQHPLSKLSWTNLLLLIALGLIGIEGLLLAARKIV